jgi:hypothetical protein
VLRPGRNDTVHVTVPATTLAGAPLHRADATPDRSSSTCPLTINVVLAVVASASGLLSVRVVSARSMCTVTVADACCPHASVAVADTTCPAPSAVTVTGDGQVTGDRSRQSKKTVTGVLCQPAALGDGTRRVEITGGAWSMS